MVDSFSKVVREWTEQTETDIRDSMLKIGLDLFAGVLLRTRVDTGRLRASWRINLNSTDTSVAESGDHAVPPEGAPPSGTETGAALETLSALVIGDEIVISNSLPYAIFIDAKDDILQDTVDDIVGKLDELIAEVVMSS